MNIKGTKNQSMFAIIFILIVVSAVVYLPLIYKLGYYKDDWYLLYAGHSQGPEIFKLIYQIDRPARAFVMGAAYYLFGNNALLYNISGYLFRLLGAISLVWLLKMLWNDHRISIMWMGILFVIYPGFLSQINPIDYQSQLIALFLGILSIALNVKALENSKPIIRVLLMILAISTGWFYLGLVEYFMGLEAFRFLCIFIIANTKSEKSSLPRKLFKTIKLWIPASIIPFGFIIWRLFLFENQRKATNIYFQLFALVTSPIQTLLTWVTNLFKDIINVIFLAWAVPLSEIAYKLNYRYFIIGLVLGIICVLIVVLGTLLMRKFIGCKENQQQSDWLGEALWLGLITVIFCLIPITIVNRIITFPHFSRYALASSIGGAIFLVALIRSIASRRLQLFLLSFLVFVGTITHYANAKSASIETETLNKFWWQVSWRIPQLEPGTNIVANYPSSFIEEDYFVWGPANLIYNPTISDKWPIQLRISATVFNEENRNNIIARQGKEFFDRRGLYFYRNFRKVLIITQPSLESCVQVIDGNQPEVSKYEDSDIVSIAPYSRIDRVLFNQPPISPPISIFGPEPFHDWCFYYEKASLARQQDDWETVVEMGDEAALNGFSPSDPIEWMPFLQAYIVLGEIEKIQPIATEINQDPFVKIQTCDLIMKMAETEQINENIINDIDQMIPCLSLE